jgi:putative DNA primase/helicase
VSNSKHLDIQAVLSMILSIISGEPVPFNRKYKRMLDALLRTHVWHFSNEVPLFSDYSLAMVWRLLVIVMKNWLKEKDAPEININLLAELEAETAGILNWSVVGLKRLIERGHFIQPNSGLVLLKEIRYKSCPDLEFIETHMSLRKRPLRSFRC